MPVPRGFVNQFAQHRRERGGIVRSGEPGGTVDRLHTAISFALRFLMQKLIVDVAVGHHGLYQQKQTQPEAERDGKPEPEIFRFHPFAHHTCAVAGPAVTGMGGPLPSFTTGRISAGINWLMRRLLLAVFATCTISLFAQDAPPPGPPGGGPRGHDGIREPLTCRRVQGQDAPGTQAAVVGRMRGGVENSRELRGIGTRFGQTSGRGPSQDRVE